MTTKPPSSISGGSSLDGPVDVVLNKRLDIPLKIVVFIVFNAIEIDENDTL
ncbi:MULTISPECIES: hypothetical protein [Clostridium]|uniref:hypothetical protein n=1 Tax=Clostridium TaxID=1485 RepID=UPI000ABB7A71|nr:MULTISPECIES: hypothetical protein [Clostridium]